MVIGFIMSKNGGNFKYLAHVGHSCVSCYISHANSWTDYSACTNRSIFVYSYHNPC